jgi:5-methylcytosine-specific restriction endonuclease McrA
MLSKKQKDAQKRKGEWKCQLCGHSIKSGGHIHHKDRNPNNNNPSNLIAVCAKCHRKITPTPKGKKDYFAGW